MLSVTITLLAAAATVSAQGIVPPYMTSFQPAPTPCLGGPQSCYTSTVTGPNPAALCALVQKPCVTLFCLRAETQTIPCPNSCCSKTPTVTSYTPCQTTCVIGCPTVTVSCSKLIG